MASLSATSAFSPVVPSISPPCRPSTRIRSSSPDYDGDRIKKAGAGITTQVPGDLCFYDPNENGMLQGTGTLMERLEKGASYFALSLSDSREEATPPPPPPPAVEPVDYPPAPSPEPTPAPKISPISNLRKLISGGNFS